MNSNIRVFPLALPLVLLAAVANANPAGEQVTNGSVTFTREGANLVIQQGSDKAIIHWQDFSIAAGELTKFVQPSNLSATLNRVTSGIPSGIHGTLEANGNIFLINPAGILIGPTGVINTNSFIASTRELDDASFLSGGDMKFVGSSPGDVVNLGTINALGGDVFLIGRSVLNQGTINAPNGTVGLAAGDEVLLAAAGDERLFVLAGSGGTAEGVTNAGTINAAQAELKAAGGNAYALAINNTGIVNATKATREGGRIILRADGGKVRSSGQLNAKGTKGGEIRVQGGEITLSAGSVTDASGDAGGGNIFIGGGFQGALLGGAPNATRTIVEPGALVVANALTSGNAGQIVLWADGHTGFGGAIHATGGPLGGDGGVVEVSGKQTLAYTGLTNVGAQLGMAGSLLLDPFEIHTFAPSNFPIFAPGIYNALGGGIGSIIDPAALAAALLSGHVTLNSDSFISISAAILWNSIFNLFLNGTDIYFDSNVVNTGGGTVVTTGTTHVMAGVTVTGVTTSPVNPNVTMIGNGPPRGNQPPVNPGNSGNGPPSETSNASSTSSGIPNDLFRLANQLTQNNLANPGFKVGLDSSGRFVITPNNSPGLLPDDPNSYELTTNPDGTTSVRLKSHEEAGVFQKGIDKAKKKYLLYDPYDHGLGGLLRRFCFVATEIYGDQKAPQLDTLRRLRDEVLTKNEDGREFVRWYYQNGEQMAKALKNEAAANAPLRALLDSFVRWLGRADWNEARNRRALAALSEILQDTVDAHAGTLKQKPGAAASLAKFAKEELLATEEGRRFLLWFATKGGGIAGGFAKHEETASVQRALFAGLAAWLEKPAWNKQKRRDAIAVLLEVLGGVSEQPPDAAQAEAASEKFLRFASPASR